MHLAGLLDDKHADEASPSFHFTFDGESDSVVVDASAASKPRRKSSVTVSLSISATGGVAGVSFADGAYQDPEVRAESLPPSPVGAKPAPGAATFGTPAAEEAKAKPAASAATNELAARSPEKSIFEEEAEALTFHESDSRKVTSPLPTASLLVEGTPVLLFLDLFVMC